VAPGNAMTRCECAGLTFRAVAEFADRDGIEGLERICQRAGCGQLCTACRPDLEAYLEARRGAGCEDGRPGHAGARERVACPSPARG